MHWNVLHHCGMTDRALARLGSKEMQLWAVPQSLLYSSSNLARGTIRTSLVEPLMLTGCGPMSLEAIHGFKVSFHSIGRPIGLGPDAGDKRPTLPEMECTGLAWLASDIRLINQSSLPPWITLQCSLVSDLVLGSLEREIYLISLQYSHEWHHEVALGNRCSLQWKIKVASRLSVAITTKK